MLVKDAFLLFPSVSISAKLFTVECLVCIGTSGKTEEYFGYVHAGNIANFTNCTTIEGGLYFVNRTFEG